MKLRKNFEHSYFMVASDPYTQEQVCYVRLPEPMTGEKLGWCRTGLPNVDFPIPTQFRMHLTPLGLHELEIIFAQKVRNMVSDVVRCID